MTPKQLSQSIDKAVTVTTAGQAALNDTQGTFYLVGFSVEMLTFNNQRRPVYKGIVSRTIRNKRSRTIRAEYLQLAPSEV